MLAGRVEGLWWMTDEPTVVPRTHLVGGGGAQDDPHAHIS